MNKIELNNIDLICINGVKEDERTIGCINSIIYSSKDIEFARKIFITTKIENQFYLDKIKNNNIEYHEIEPLTYQEYNDFVLYELNKYITNEFCLIINDDGFILNPKLWLDDFLNYDYIGAPWTFGDKQVDWVINNCVGNGGFCLRSKKFLEEIVKMKSEMNFKRTRNEDIFICDVLYDYFIKKGIKYAPIEIANKFSKEVNTQVSFNSVFGFHGNKQFIQYLNNKKA
jgi:hypothetical protein